MKSEGLWGDELFDAGIVGIVGIADAGGGRRNGALVDVIAEPTELSAAWADRLELPT